MEVKLKKYRTVKSLQRDLRRSENIPDFIYFQNNLYEMSSYDMEGKYIYWEATNIDYYLAICMTTKNRYGKTGRKDAIIDLCN